MLSNAYFVAKFRFDTPESEPAKNLQKKSKKFLKNPFIHPPVCTSWQRAARGQQALRGQQSSARPEDKGRVGGAGGKKQAGRHEFSHAAADGKRLQQEIEEDSGFNKFRLVYPLHHLLQLPYHRAGNRELSACCSARGRELSMLGLH